MNMERIPSWTERSLQSLAYWIGWTHERYPFWPLSEGSMVAEARAAIAARLDSSQAAIAEVATQNLVPAAAAAELDLRNGRVDLVIVQRINGKIPDESQIRCTARALIEIKRGQASWTEIDKDLNRLAKIVGKLKIGTRAFLIVGCEHGNAPKEFVRNGVAIRGRHPVTDGMYIVRRVWRANPARISIRAASMVVLVEVVSNHGRRNGVRPCNQTVLACGNLQPPKR